MSEHAHVDGVHPFPAVMQTRTIETNGTSIHVRVGGHGPAVVMLHGFGTTGDMWGHLASALIEDHMVVAPDLRGEATFGPLIGAVMRCVADNVEAVIIPDCGHWITEEQPQATTDLVVDFLHRRS